MDLPGLMVAWSNGGERLKFKPAALIGEGNKRETRNKIQVPRNRQGTRDKHQGTDKEQETNFKWFVS